MNFSKTLSSGRRPRPSESRARDRGRTRKLDSKTVYDLLRFGTSFLSDRPRPSLEARILLGHAGSLSEVQIFAAPEETLSPRSEARYLRLLERRRSGVPLSYLTGTKEFWSLALGVSPSVLIPRPETEVLVEKVLELSSRDDETILDMGTGSGNIAIALAR